jgi:hypothetical protein
VIELLRDFTGLALEDAKELAESTDVVLKQGMSEPEARVFAQALQDMSSGPVVEVEVAGQLGVVGQQVAQDRLAQAERPGAGAHAGMGGEDGPDLAAEGERIGAAEGQEQRLAGLGGQGHSWRL